MLDKLLEFEVTTWPVVIAVAVVAALTVVAALVLTRNRHRVWGVLTGILALGLVALSIGAVINLHFGYYRTIDELIGETPGGASLGAVNEMVAAGTVPTAGVVVAETIPGTVSGVDRSRPATVYLPPAWFHRPRPELPVLFLLHGSPGQTTDWVDGGEANKTMDTFAATHGGVAPVVVMPDINAGEIAGDTECVDSPTTKEETYLSVDVPAWVKRNLAPAGPPHRWAVGGLSEGGFCSFMLTLRHPDVWRSFLNFSGENAPSATGEPTLNLFGGSQADLDAHSPMLILQQPNPVHQELGAYFGVGSSDDAMLVEQVKAGAAATAAAGIPTELRLLAGGHEFFYWSRALQQAMPWIAPRLGI